MKIIQGLLLALGLLNASLASAAQPQAFPKGPEAELTPGSLCERSQKVRYPEKIPYCSRDVDSSLKKEVIADYDQRYGYRVGSMDRGNFKIDHHIPLCMGGSNERDNLWPQHRTVYEITDPLEPAACAQMARGKLKQAEAVELIRKAKAHLELVPGILAYIQGL